MKLKGLRVDPGYLVEQYPNPTDAASAVVKDCVAYGVNTIFVFAFSPVYGRYYFTNLPQTWADTPYGTKASTDFFAAIIPVAHAAGLKVVASFPLNLYQKIATGNPLWQTLREDRSPYQVTYGASIVNPLSAWNPGYRTWFTGLIKDALAKIHNLDGIEAVEGNVAASFETGAAAPDYNAGSLAVFTQIHPGAHVGDNTWIQFRADGMTGLHKIMHDAAYATGTVQSYVVNGLSCVYKTKNLMAPSDYAKACGFDWQAVSNLGFTGLIQEATWQQAEVNGREQGLPAGTFVPQWTATAVSQFGQLLPGAVPIKMVHVEVTPFSGKTASGPFTITPTAPQFQTALSEALAGAQGCTVYSYSLLKTNGTDNAYATALKAVYSASSATP